MKGLTSYVTSWGRETTIFITAFLIGTFLFIAVTVYGASVVGSAITGVGTTSPLWGDLAVDQQAGQGRLKGVFVVGDNGTTTPFIFVTQKGVVSMGSSTPSPLLLFPSDLVASSTYVTALGVNNATTTRGDFVVGSYRFSVFGSNRIGELGTSSPILDDGVSIGGAAGTHGDLYVSGGLGVANATSSDGSFVVGNGTSGLPMLAFSNNGRFVVGTSTAMTSGTATTTKFVFDGGDASFSSGSAATTTFSILNTAGTNATNACIEMSTDGILYRVFINSARTGMLVEAGSCMN